MFPNLSADIQRYIKDPHDRRNIYLVFEQGIWALVVYRFGRWVHSIHIPLISFILKLIAFLLFKLTEILTGISIPASTDIKKGLYIGHFGGIIIHSDVKIGENCSIGPGVVIGTRGLGKEGAPTLGNHVYVGTGAKILGKILIGDNVRIGANAVVLIDVPDNATVTGIPAKIIKTNNS
ncbi:MAG: serine O-acetyltransferase [Candidatus Omnitrophica bacterium]|nr:serine O-acetyltransferase [Candidatus Omnitrophota bacterium]